MLAAIHTHPSTPHKSDHIDQALHKTKTDLAAVAIMSPAFNGIKITWPITQKEDPFLCNKLFLINKHLRSTKSFSELNRWSFHRIPKTKERIREKPEPSDSSRIE